MAEFLVSLEEEGILIESFQTTAVNLKNSDFNLVIDLDEINKKDLFTEKTLSEIKREKEEKERIERETREKYRIEYEKKRMETDIKSYQYKYPEEFEKVILEINKKQTR